LLILKKIGRKSLVPYDINSDMLVFHIGYMHMHIIELNDGHYILDRRYTPSILNYPTF
jgi:hypothetical protein